MSNKDFNKKKIDPYKPKMWENKNYIIPDEENFDKINKLYSDFFTMGYDDILLQFNKENILNYRTEDGKTLIIAVLENQELNELQKKNIIEKLIHLKVSINAKDKYNKTSLHVACENGYNSIIQLLIEKKVLKNELDNNGNAPVHYYVEKFIKDCNDYDVYKKNPNTINPQRKKYSEIIDNLLTLQIINNIQKNNNDYKKIKELIKLIKFFDINKINIEYNTFIEDSKFKLDEITYPEKKNKIFKQYIQLKNNIFKLFEEKNKIEYYDDDTLQIKISEKKKFIVTELKDLNNKINGEIESIVNNIEIIKNPLLYITETLLLLIFIENSYDYQFDIYLQDKNLEISKNCYSSFGDLLTKNRDTIFNRIQELITNIHDENEKNGLYKEYRDNIQKLIKRCTDLLISNNRSLLVNMYEDIKSLGNEIKQNLNIVNIELEVYKPDIEIKPFIDKSIDYLSKYMKSISKQNINNNFEKTINIYDESLSLVDNILPIYKSREEEYLKNILNLNNTKIILKTANSTITAINFMLIYFGYQNNDLDIVFGQPGPPFNNPINYLYTNCWNSVDFLYKSVKNYYDIIFTNIRYDDTYLQTRESIQNKVEEISLDQYIDDNYDRILTYYTNIEQSYKLAKIGHDILTGEQRNENIYKSEWKRTITIINNLFIKYDDSVKLFNDLDGIISWGTNTHRILKINELNYLNEKQKMILQAAAGAFILIYNKIPTELRNVSTVGIANYSIYQIQRIAHLTSVALIAAYITNIMYDYFPEYVAGEINGILELITRTAATILPIDLKGFLSKKLSKAVIIGMFLSQSVATKFEKSGVFGALKSVFLDEPGQITQENFTLLENLNRNIELIDTLSVITTLPSFTNYKSNAIDILGYDIDTNFDKKLIQVNDCINDIYKLINDDESEIDKEINIRSLIINSFQEAIELVLPQFNAIRYDLQQKDITSNNYIKAVIYSASGYNSPIIDTIINPSADVKEESDISAEIIALANNPSKLEDYKNIKTEKLLEIEFILEKIKNYFTPTKNFPNVIGNKNILRISAKNIIKIAKRLFLFDNEIKENNYANIKELYNNNFESIKNSILARIGLARLTNKFKIKILGGDFTEPVSTNPLTRNTIPINNYTDFVGLGSQEFLNNIYDTFQIIYYSGNDPNFTGKSTMVYLLSDSFDNFYYIVNKNNEILNICKKKDENKKKLEEYKVFKKDILKRKSDFRERNQNNYDTSKMLSSSKEMFIKNIQENKNQIFSKFGINTIDLFDSSYNDNNNSFIFHTLYKSFNQKLISINDVNERNKKNKQQFFDENKEKESKILLNNIKSEILKKFNNGEITMDIENDNGYFNFIRFYDDNSSNVFNYKYFNIYYIIELINKYIEDIQNINLPPLEDEDLVYFEKISVNTIIKIYTNYEKIICIINNLNVIYRKYLNINIDKNEIIYYLDNLKEANYITFEINTKRGKKKYKINGDKINNDVLKGGANNIYIKKINEIKIKKNDNINEGHFGQIYENFRNILDHYNKIIEKINNIYSLRYFENPKNISLYTNRLMNINIEVLPKFLKDYYNNFFDNYKIKTTNIEKILLKFNDYNYNEIYGENIDYDFKYYYIDNEFYYKLEKIVISGDNVLEIKNSDLLQKFEGINKEYILGEINQIQTNNNEFKVGYFINDDNDSQNLYITKLNEKGLENNSNDKNPIYEKEYNNINRNSLTGNFIIKANKYIDDKIIILAIYYYDFFLHKYLKEVRESITNESTNIFNSVKCNFSEKYSSENRDTKKIIKNLDKIIGNKEEMKELIKLKFDNIIKIILEHESNIETNRIIKILFKNSEKFNKIKELVEKYEDNDRDDFIYKVKNLLDVRPYIIDNFKDIDNREFSVKIINNTCLNNTCLKMIKNFKFNLRLPDKNGNTVIHRLIDQLNYEGIDKLLNPQNGDTAIITFKNKNNQTPIEYLLESLNITIKKYGKKEIEQKIEDIALKIDDDYVKIYESPDNIISESKLKWTIKDTKIVYYYSLNQFNSFLWLKLYEFKNNINNDDIVNLKKILKSHINIKEDLLIRSVDIKEIEKKLNKMFLRTDNKKNLENEFINKNCDELSNLYNSRDNLSKIKNNELFNSEEIQKEIQEIEKQIKIKENLNVDIEKFIKEFNKKQEDRVQKIINNLENIRKNLISKFNLNMEEFTKLSKNLEEDYLKLLHLLHDIKLEETNFIYISDFNYQLINTDINNLGENQCKSYYKYFENHLNTIFMDFNDLEKYEDYNINYVNYQILEIININMVSTISWEIYNGILKYILEKYDLESKDKKLNTKLIIKNVKILLKNKIYDTLSIKNPDKVYEPGEFYKDIIINTFIDYTNKKLEDDDKKNMEQIIDFYSRILENIVSLFYNDIKDNLIDQRKIVLLLKIYEKLKYYEKIINK
jgi:hypothetical protein